jgi:hypothetical protein
MAPARAAFLVSALALVGCGKKDEDQKPAGTITLGGIPGMPASQEAPAATPTETKTKLPPPIEQPREASAPPPASIYIPGSAIRRQAAARDPDQDVVDAARVQAARCFDGMPTAGAPSRSATITVTVVATGRVTRTEVQTPGSSDERLASCLKSVGSGLTFTQKHSHGNTAAGSADQREADVRTFTIDVNVSASR